MGLALERQRHGTTEDAEVVVVHGLPKHLETERDVWDLGLSYGLTYVFFVNGLVEFMKLILNDESTNPINQQPGKHMNKTCSPCNFW